MMKQNQPGRILMTKTERDERAKLAVIQADYLLSELLWPD
jgi:hypothetical protein